MISQMLEPIRKNYFFSSAALIYPRTIPTFCAKKLLLVSELMQGWANLLTKAPEKVDGFA